MTKKIALILCALVIAVAGLPATASQATIREYLVEFDGPTPAGTVGRLAEAGAVVLGPGPDGGISVRATSEVAAVIGVMPGVESVAPAPVMVASPPPSGGEAVEGLYLVRFHFDSRPESISGLRDVTVLASSETTALVSAGPTGVSLLQSDAAVAGVEAYGFRSFRNDEGGGVILGSALAEAAGYDGSGQIIGVADSGLGGGTPATAHRDIPAGRIVAINDWPAADLPGCWDAIPDGPVDVDSGHGTHVAGSAVSAGGPDGAGRGTAPGASLVFQSVEDYAVVDPGCGGGAGYLLLGLPLDVYDLPLQAHQAGARVHSNSWGTDDNGQYNTDSSAFDSFIWDYPDMTMVVAAGNAGPGAGTVGSPATAKNVIAVGASENERPSGYPCDDVGGVPPFTSCAGVGSFNSPGADADNAEQMAEFSSRGPTVDGRIKPDVVAPGAWILSTYSDMFQEGYDAGVNPQNGFYQWDGEGFPYDEHYKYMSGTSMAAPLVSGAAAVVRQYFDETEGHEASAALVKAMLINSAVDLADENNDGVDDNDLPIPNMVEGWGRVDVAEAVDGDRLWVDGDEADTGGSVAYGFATAGGGPLKISLVWSDYPASPGATSTLVNDLDLVITAPNGTTYLGNRFSGGWSTTGGSADEVNNVENVYIQSPAAGTWMVEVRGYDVPFGPQPFALVVDGATGTADARPAVTLTAPGSSVAGTVTVTASAVRATSVEFRVDGTVIGTDDSSAGGWSIPWNTIGTAEGSRSLTAVATGPAGTRTSAAVSVVVDNLQGEGTFGDDNGSVHQADIEAIAASGITRGCNPPDYDLFCPTDNVTRGQMAGFLNRALTLAASSRDTFIDDDESVFEADIEALAAAGITRGCNPPTLDRFCPDDQITRAQMAAFLVRALDLPSSSGDRFADDNGSVFESDIEALAAAGITRGCNPPANDRFCPEAPVTRGEMASFLVRALGLTPLTP